MARKALISIVSLIVSLGLLSSCASTSGAKNMQASKAYLSLADQLSVEDELYSGFSNVFHYSATLLSEELSQSQLAELKRVRLWSDAELNKERRKVIESIANETKIFMSFYTPEIRYNDLNESSSVWRVFLDVEGRRYTAKISKSSTNYADTRSLYPKHTPWGKPYILKFPIPFSKLQEAGKARLVITGSLGVSKKEFILK